MPQRITEANLGAWLIKCNPEAGSDLPRRIAETGFDRVTSWCVADNYRSRLMQPGHKAIFWVSGSGRRMTRGVWGVGWVFGGVRAATHDVALDIPLFEAGQEIAAADLVAAGVSDLEVQLQPQMSNPSWVSRQQLPAVERLLDGWPQYLAPQRDTTTAS